MSLNHKKQTNVTRAIINVAISLLEYGAESILIEQSTTRLGKALGVDSVEISMIPSAIVLTTLCNEHCVTTTRRVHKKGINMAVISYIQKIILEVESKSLDEIFVMHALNRANPVRYNKALVIFMVGIACMSFAYLQNGDINTLIITFFSSSVAMAIKFQLDKRNFLHVLSFGTSAFFATVIASLALYTSHTPHIALASSVLFLFPGFPFINSLLDSLKGYLSMGWGRWLFASLLTFSTAIGIILATTLLNIKDW